MQAGLHSTDDKLDSMELAHTKFKEDMAHFRQDIFTTLHRNKEELQEQITDNSTFLNDLSKNFQAEIGEVRTLATDSIKQQNKELVDRFSGQFNEVD